MEIQSVPITHVLAPLGLLAIASYLFEVSPSVFLLPIAPIVAYAYLNRNTISHEAAPRPSSDDVRHDGGTSDSRAASETRDEVASHRKTPSETVDSSAEGHGESLTSPPTDEITRRLSFGSQARGASSGSSGAGRSSSRTASRTDGDTNEDSAHGIGSDGALAVSPRADIASSDSGRVTAPAPPATQGRRSTPLQALSSADPASAVRHRLRSQRRNVPAALLSRAAASAAAAATAEVRRRERGVGAGGFSVDGRSACVGHSLGTAPHTLFLLPSCLSVV